MLDHVKKRREETGTDRRINIAHVSTIEGIDLCRKYDWVTTEITPHHLLLDEEWADAHPNRSNVNPPLRSRKHVDYLRRALNKGWFSFYANDDAPHSPEEKAKGVPGLNSSDVYGMTVAELLWGDEFGLDAQKVADLCCRNPARFMGLHDRGRIEVGMRADIVLLKREKTMVTGDMLLTKNKVCPYEGMTFAGYIDTVVKNGHIVKSDGNVVL